MPDLSPLRNAAREAAGRSHAPYSPAREGCALLLSTGEWIPGARVENASFSLLIPAVVNAISTMYASGRSDAVALVSTRPFNKSEIVFVDGLFDGLLKVANGDMIELSSDGLPEPARPLPLLYDAGPVHRASDGVEAARAVSDRARVPASEFPVGCIIELAGGGLIPGCNVEHPDWTRILCAERNALGTAVTLGETNLRRIFVSAPKDATVSPCGSCRQVMVELAPIVPVFLDRGSNPPLETTAGSLLPGWFAGSSLKKGPVG